METTLFILSHPQLVLTLILCIVSGSISFCSAINLAGLKGFSVTSFKYLLTFISIESLSNFFMIVLAPSEFLQHSLFFSSLQIGIWMLLSWIVFYEAKWILNKYKSMKYKRYNREGLISKISIVSKRT